MSHGTFNGRRWREQILPRVRDFILMHDTSSLSDLTKNGSETEITMRFLSYIRNYLTIYGILLIENCAKRLSPTGC
jgi:hypothetical protein